MGLQCPGSPGQPCRSRGLCAAAFGLCLCLGCSSSCPNASAQRKGLISVFGVCLWLFGHNKGLTWSLSNWFITLGRENRFVMLETS